MGIFGKKRINVSKELAKINALHGDWYQSFYFAHKAKLDAYDAKIVRLRVQARDAKTDEVKLQKLIECKDTINAMREYCVTKFHGEKYYLQHDRTNASGGSYYQAVIDEIKELRYIIDVVSPGIISLASADGGILQKDLYKHFDIGQGVVRDQVAALERQKKITREKKGSTYVINAVK